MTPNPSAADKNGEPRAATSLLVIGAGCAGVLLALALLGFLLPGMVISLVGPEPHAYWYLSRASGLTAYLLLWASVALGLLVTTRLGRMWPGLQIANDIHEYISLLGLGFTAFHILILLGDRFMGYTLFELLVPNPFSSRATPQMFIGQLGLYLFVAVVVSFYVRKRIGYQMWRMLHYASFGLVVFVVAHSIIAGPDSSNVLVQTMYWTTGAILLFLTLYRMLPHQEPKPAAVRN